MSLTKKYNAIIVNVLLAAVSCLVINFSYLIAIREQERNEDRLEHRWQRRIESAPMATGTLKVSADGYGYIIVAPAGDEDLPGAPGAPAPPTDSVYVPSRDIDRLALTDGSTMRVATRRGEEPGSNRVMLQALDIDGVPFDYGQLYDHPSDQAMMVLQLAFYFAFAFALLTVMTAGAANNVSVKFYLKRAALCVAIAAAMWLLLPVMKPRSGELTIMATMFGENFIPVDIMLMKCLFVLAFALLYGRIYQLINQRESIMLENEQLKSENLRAKYNTLVGQINPHFLFNSLNSLSALVREGSSDDAVRYIDRLSDTFRYTIRNEPNATTTLGEELEFVSAYKYLLEVRYDEKLFIDIDVEPEKLGWKLPTFSVQPLVENAVKHNSITRARPLRISIRTEGSYLVVSNPINPKIEPEKGTGIGLANLANRWQLLTGRSIEVVNDGETFTVKLPFLT
jgi:hypothetical protein